MMGAFLGLWPIPTPAISPEARRYREGRWQPAPFRHSGTRGRWVYVSAGLLLLVCLAGLIVTAEGLDLATRIKAGETIRAGSLTSWQDSAEALAGWYMIGIVALVASLLVWLYRAAANLPALAGGVPRHSPLQTVGWWFVPLANFVLPYRIVKEAWERYAIPSRRGGKWRLLAWWISLVVGGIGFFAASTDWRSWQTVIGDVTSNPDAARVRLSFVTIALVVLAAACVLTMYLVREIQARAHLRAAALGYNVPRYWQPAMGTWMAPGGGIPAIPATSSLPSALAVPPALAIPPALAVPSAPAWPGTPTGNPYGAYPGQPGSWSPPVVPTTAWPWAPPPPPAQPRPSFAPPPAPAIPPAEPLAEPQESAAAETGLTAAGGTCSCGASYPAGVRFCAACGFALA